MKTTQKTGPDVRRDWFVSKSIAEKGLFHAFLFILEYNLLLVDYYCPISYN